MFQTRTLVVLIASVSLVHCTGNRAAPVGTGATQSDTIGTNGGRLTIEDVTLTVPPGALSVDQPLSVTSSPEAAPEAVSPISPVYEFGPSGLTFESAAEIKIPAGGEEDATIYWSSPD